MLKNEASALDALDAVVSVISSEARNLALIVPVIPAKVGIHALIFYYLRGKHQ